MAASSIGAVERCTFLENSGQGSGLYTDRSETLVLSSTFMGNDRDAIRVGGSGLAALGLAGPAVADIIGCLSKCPPITKASHPP